MIGFTVRGVRLAGGGALGINEKGGEELAEDIEGVN